MQDYPAAASAESVYLLAPFGKRPGPKPGRQLGQNEGRRTAYTEATGGGAHADLSAISRVSPRLPVLCSRAIVSSQEKSLGALESPRRLPGRWDGLASGPLHTPAPPSR